MQNGLCECDKVKDPEMEINLDYSGVSTLEKQRDLDPEEVNVMTEAETGLTWSRHAGSLRSWK